MDRNVARRIAYAGHLPDRDRHGQPMIDHVTRVAASVPPEAEPTAWLHDLLEKSGIRMVDLAPRGLTAEEGEALDLLTRRRGECHEAHTLRIAHARGPAARLARTVKLADLDDHLAQPWAPGDPPYGWARRHVENAVARLDRGVPPPGPPRRGVAAPGGALSRPQGCRPSAPRPGGVSAAGP